MLAYAYLVLLVLPLVLVAGNVALSRRRRSAKPRREFFGDAIEAQRRAAR